MIARGGTHGHQTGFKARWSGSCAVTQATTVQAHRHYETEHGSLGSWQPGSIDSFRTALCGPSSKSGPIRPPEQWTCSSAGSCLCGRGELHSPPVRLPICIRARSTLNTPNPAPCKDRKLRAGLCTPTPLVPAQESSETETEKWVVTASWLNLHQKIQFRGLIHNLLPPKTWTEVAGWMLFLLSGQHWQAWNNKLHATIFLPLYALRYYFLNYFKNGPHKLGQA